MVWLKGAAHVGEIPSLLVHVAVLSGQDQGVNSDSGCKPGFNKDLFKISSAN